MWVVGQLGGQNVAPPCSGPKIMYLYQLAGSIAFGNEARGIRSSPPRVSTPLPAAAFFACLWSGVKRKLPWVLPDPPFPPWWIEPGRSLASRPSLLSVRGHTHGVGSSWKEIASTSLACRALGQVPESW